MLDQRKQNCTCALIVLALLWIEHRGRHARSAQLEPRVGVDRHPHLQIALAQSTVMRVCIRFSSVTLVDWAPVVLASCPQSVKPTYFQTNVTTSRSKLCTDNNALDVLQASGRKKPHKQKQASHAKATRASEHIVPCVQQRCTHPLHLGQNVGGRPGLVVSTQCTVLSQRYGSYMRMVHMVNSVARSPRRAHSIAETNPFTTIESGGKRVTVPIHPSVHPPSFCDQSDSSLASTCLAGLTLSHCVLKSD